MYLQTQKIVVSFCLQSIRKREEKRELKEAAISQSPHVFDPLRELTPEERQARYRTRIDASFKPYTVFDILQKVYHRSFEDDLLSIIGEFPEDFKTSSSEWSVSRVWVNSLQVIRSESVFFQPTEDFQVDILIDTRIKFEEVRAGNNFLKNRYNITPQLRLRYSFDLRPCHMNCRFVDVIRDEKDSLIAKDEYKIPVDKYFLPVLKGNDYNRMARYLMYKFMRQYYDSDEPVDPAAWIYNSRLKVKYGVFPEEGVLGEYFFSFGMADIVDLKTGVITPTEINPGTIVLNQDIAKDEARRKSTLAHELIHYYLGGYFFLLQKMHGHEYCSYMCKRFDKSREQQDKWTPVDIMEMHANKMPGFLLIQDKPGRAYAEEVMDDLGWKRDLVSMNRMVEQMAAHFETTKTVAKTRLIDFGYNEVRGLMQSANGGLVPSYISNLAENETYTIDEADGVREYVRNAEFRKRINTGEYLYVEGHYCLNNSRFLYRDQFGYHHLTPYAREHMNECCLVFKRIYQNSVVQLINGIIQKGIGKGRQDIRYQKKDGASPVTDEGRKTLAMIRQQKADKAVIEKSFNQMTVELMDRRKINILPLAEATGLSRDTIKNMRNDPNRLFPIQEIVAVAIALHLSPEVSREYIRHAPTNFLDTEEMYCYQYALNEWYMLTVAEVNRRLVEMGIKPLTNLVAGYDENGVKLEDDRSRVC